MKTNKNEKIDILDLLDEHTPFCVGYWLIVPIYFVWFIIFSKKPKDPLGLYRGLTETGEASYD